MVEEEKNSFYNGSGTTIIERISTFNPPLFGSFTTALRTRKADSFGPSSQTDDSTFSHGEQTVSRPNVHGVCEANESEFSEKKQVPYVRRSGFLLDYYISI